MAAVCSVMVERYAPHVAMVAIQFGYAGMNIITSAALAYGMNQFVYVCYRHAVATFFITPFAFFLERRVRPAMTFSIFCRIFLLALCGITMNQNLYAAGLHYTSPTFTSAMNNLVPAITFLIAVIFGLESVNIKSMRGQAKVIGTIVCVGGAMTMTLYKGPFITRIFSRGLNLGMRSSYRSLTDNGSLSDWTFGALYLIASVILWSAWINLQAATLKRYPAQLSLTATMCFLATAQSGIVACYFDRDPSVWTLKWNIELLSITYAGIINSGITYFVTAWCIKRRGPVFMAMFNPLVTVIVAIMGSIILHEILHVGSVVGAVLVISGLYIVLWGKAEDNQKLHRLSTTNAANGSVKPSNSIKTTDCNIDIDQPLLAT